MQNASMASKVKVLYDGAEVPGLVRFGEVGLEDGTIEVPSIDKKNKIRDGVTTMPEITATYETRRGTNTRQFFSDYYRGKLVKDLTVIRVDASGAEYGREMWASVECKAFKDPEVDHGSVSYAKIDVVLLPYNITPVSV